ncbi:hypothetical protein FTO60_05915 [Octadecabacter sp. SW4]|uniref:hypothetical protein n=1 Tax=Octadecabacter sp. SW4 TaxID=2602067 RepID=UPI0011C20555|nr:hypothetical protein [Octadecabacter sp. SW4]QEE35288.1 hypothetical protein FTO60_05915 [Octadecabacter sp. SW4]|tara:strand:+ start:900 stop:1208 length:309 start_codon:yes stop_codon:yes gene_type:complete
MLTIPPGAGLVSQASAPTRPSPPHQDADGPPQPAAREAETGPPPPSVNRISGADAQALVQGLIDGNAAAEASNSNGVSQRLVADAQVAYGGAAVNVSLSQMK